MSKLLATTAAFVAILAVPALALDIENRDGAEHQVTISVGEGGPTSLKLAAGKMLKNACSDVCNVQLETGAGAGQFVSIHYGEKAVISNGRITVEARQ
jgi:hypothetical protein